MAEKNCKSMGIETEPYFFYFNRLAFVKERGIILVNKDKHAIFKIIQMIFKEADNYEEKKQNRHSLCSRLATADAWNGSRDENKAETGSKEKDNDGRQTYKLKLKGVPSKAKVKWKTSKKSVVSIAKKRGNTVALKAKKKGTAVVTATYKKKKYKCRITVRTNKNDKPAADNPVLNSSDVTLYYLSEEYKDYITYDSSHLREYRFRVSGTKKEVRDWKITGSGADYFRITDYGLLQMDWEPAYVEPCVTVTVTAILEDGRKLTATVRAYSEVNIYIDKVFTDFEKQYITPDMTEKEKAEKTAWYISTTSDYELYNSNWGDIFIKGKGDCYASRYAVQYMCNHMGIKALVCRNYDAHGQTLVFADDLFLHVLENLWRQGFGTVTAFSDR